MELRHARATCAAAFANPVLALHGRRTLRVGHAKCVVVQPGARHARLSRRCTPSACDMPGTSRRAGKRVVQDIELADIIRPLAKTRTNDAAKVQRLMSSIAKEGLHVPIDILEVDGRYYGFSGCHRFEACQRLGRKTISCRIIKATPEVLKRHLM